MASEILEAEELTTTTKQPPTEDGSCSADSFFFTMIHFAVGHVTATCRTMMTPAMPFFSSWTKRMSIDARCASRQTSSRSQIPRPIRTTTSTVMMVLKTGLDKYDNLREMAAFLAVPYHQAAACTSAGQE